MADSIRMLAGCAIWIAARSGSAFSKSDTRLLHAKADLLQLRIAEKCRDVIPRSEVDETLRAIAGIVTTHLAGMAARCTPDLRISATIDAVVRQVAPRWPPLPTSWPMNVASRRLTHRGPDSPSRVG